MVGFSQSVSSTLYATLSPLLTLLSDSRVSNFNSYFQQKKEATALFLWVSVRIPAGRSLGFRGETGVGAASTLHALGFGVEWAFPHASSQLCRKPRCCNTGEASERDQGLPVKISPGLPRRSEQQCVVKITSGFNKRNKAENSFQSLGLC